MCRPYGHSRTLTDMVLAGLVILNIFSSISLASGMIVSTRNGQLRGNVQYTRLLRPFFAYRGIPYAAPPVGDLRFEPPQPAQNWTGIRDATSFGNRCLQKLGGSEDCLYLNVYTRQVSMNAKLPVMVFIHGGQFTMDSSDPYTGGYFLDEQVVLVTINYRLHSLGFLNTMDGAIKGNMGLKDQVAALQWVQDNIGNFGGDASRVTVFGQSAGGSSASYMMLSPLAKGLFSRAISESGVATKLYAIAPKPREAALLLAQRLNCPTNSSEEMVKCLKRAEGADIVRYSTIGLVIKEDVELFCPSVEVDAPGAFITKHPFDIIKDGEAMQLPWISGVNSDEGLLFAGLIALNLTLVNEINTDWPSVAPRLLYYNATDTDLTTRITQFYFGTNSTVNYFTDFPKIAKLLSDRLYTIYTQDTGITQSQYSEVRLYLNDYRLVLGNNQGVSHEAELPLLFPLVPYIGRLSRHYEMSRNLVKTWVQFASGSSNLNFRSVQWTPVNNNAVNNGEGVQYLKFSNAGNSIVSDPLRERMQFWRELDMYKIVPANTG